MGKSKNGCHLMMSSYWTKGSSPLCWYRQSWSWLCCLYSEDKILPDAVPSSIPPVPSQM